MQKIRFNLFALKNRLEKLQGRDIPWSELADGAKLNRNTIDSIVHQRASGIRLQTASKLLEYFRGQGLQITIADLFIEPGQEEQPADQVPA